MAAGTGYTIAACKHNTVCNHIVKAICGIHTRLVYYRSKDDKLPHISDQSGPEQNGEVFFDVRLQFSELLYPPTNYGTYKSAAKSAHR